MSWNKPEAGKHLSSALTLPKQEQRRSAAGSGCEGERCAAGAAGGRARRRCDQHRVGWVERVHGAAGCGGVCRGCHTCDRGASVCLPLPRACQLCSQIERVVGAQAGGAGCRTWNARLLAQMALAAGASATLELKSAASESVLPAGKYAAQLTAT